MSLRCAVQQWRHKTVLGDKISMVVFFFGGLLLLWYELYYVASFNHDGWTLGYWLHCGLGVFFAINIYGNWIMMFLTQPSGKDIVFPSGPTPPGWRYCDACVANRPPRSYHCPICHVCVLRRDHHCWFAGTCAGHANHRYFLALVVQVTIVALYCDVYNWPFVWAIKGDPSLLTLVSFFLPHVTGALGQETWQSFFVTAMSMLGLSLTLLFLWLLQIQCAQILRGQTRYERKKGIVDYHQGSLGANLREVLGRRSLLILLWPWMPSRLPGDGVWFQSQVQKAS